MNAMHAIPTAYKGIKFRSRLEARWAAMFDLIGWKWEYEPVDLAGYIPDFVMTNFKRDTIVEVKSALRVEDLTEHQGKIDRSGWEGEAIIVGARIWIESEDLVIGALKESGPDWHDCSVTSCSHNNGRPDLVGMAPCGMFTPIAWDSSWECKICGMYGKHNLYGRDTEFMSAWTQAGNRTQWRRKR